MSTYYVSDGLLGVSVHGKNLTSSQEFPLLTVARLTANKTAIYVKFGEATTATSASAGPIAINAAGTASASAGGFFVDYVAAAGQYGWIRTSAADVTLA